MVQGVRGKYWVEESCLFKNGFGIRHIRLFVEILEFIKISIECNNKYTVLGAGFACCAVALCEGGKPALHFCNEQYPNL